VVALYFTPFRVESPAGARGCFTCTQTMRNPLPNGESMRRFLVMLLVLSVQAWGDDLQGVSFFDGNKIYEFMNDPKSKDSVLGYVMGISDSSG
jgi:hypothetical protein